MTWPINCSRRHHHFIGKTTSSLYGIADKLLTCIKQQSITHLVSVLASSEVGHGFEPRSVKPKTIKLVFVASPLSTQH